MPFARKPKRIVVALRSMPRNGERMQLGKAAALGPRGQNGEGAPRAGRGNAPRVGLDVPLASLKPPRGCNSVPQPAPPKPQQPQQPLSVSCKEAPAEKAMVEKVQPDTAGAVSQPKDPLPLTPPPRPNPFASRSQQTRHSKSPHHPPVTMPERNASHK